MSMGANNFCCSLAENRLHQSKVRTRFAMLLFLATEAMFFAGLISAYIVLSASVTVWPPVDQPRLPISLSAFNTFVLLWSALCLFFAKKQFCVQRATKGFLVFLGLTILGGGVFLCIQGYEWLELIRFGMATANNVYAGTFYVLIGVHGLHVLSGLLFLIWFFARVLRRDSLLDLQNIFLACRMYWYFVVGVWPILYWLVYL